MILSLVNLNVSPTSKLQDNTILRVIPQLNHLLGVVYHLMSHDEIHLFSPIRFLFRPQNERAIGFLLMAEMRRNNQLSIDTLSYFRSVLYPPRQSRFASINGTDKKCVTHQSVEESGELPFRSPP